LLALAAVGACLVLGGLVFAGVYLVARDDPGASEGISSLPEASGSSLERGAAEAGESSGSLDGGGSSLTERGFPTDSESAIEAEAEGVLRDFHVAVVEGDFQYAWSLLTARKRRQEDLEKGYAGWRDAQATLTPYLLPEGIEVQIDGLEDEGVARVLIVGMGWTQPSSPCSEWSGLTWVRYEGGAWRYDPGYSTTAERRRRWQGQSDRLLGVGC
jgi:hypothetical protein